MSGVMSAADVSMLLAAARQKLSDGQPTAALQMVVGFLRAQGGEMAVLSALHHARTLYHSGAATSSTADELSVLFAQCALAEGGGSPQEQAQSQQRDLPSPMSIAPSSNPHPRDMQASSSQGFPQNMGGPVSHYPPLDTLLSSYPPIGAGVSNEMNGGSGFREEKGEGTSGSRDQWNGFGSEVSVTSCVPILAESGRLQVVADASADGSSFTCPYCQGVVKASRQAEHLELWCPGSS
eukprot:TRINITY_DN30928_c0_g1_i1.p1 TRINITY_DN30928_c0_g1~~TRINITY_DN30928_c0_g1_i1.p1  ORF type:complete len:237 (-),score=43.34 TRINITY_DN30928_c0_g1_i1:75-785(-)